MQGVTLASQFLLSGREPRSSCGHRPDHLQVGELWRESPRYPSFSSEDVSWSPPSVLAFLSQRGHWAGSLATRTGWVEQPNLFLIRATDRSQPVVCMSPASPTPCLSLILSFLLFYFNTRAFTVEIDGAQGWLFSSLHRNICGDGSARPLSTLVSSSFKPEPGAVSQPLPVSIFLRAKETGPVSVWSERALHC